MRLSENGHPMLNREELKVKVAECRSNRKGLLILGQPGMGKTYAIKSSRMSSAQNLAMEYQAHGLQAVKSIVNNMMHYENLTVTIDDVGFEQSVKNFGSALDPVEYVIHTLYDINQVADEPITLLMSTNLTVANLQQRYGIRVVDRIHEMCDIVVLEDTNLRRS